MQVTPSLILGTRGSALALAQTALAQTALARAALEGSGTEPSAVAVREIRTTGDKRQDLSLTAIGGDGHGYISGRGERIDPGLFTKELESALLAGEIDVAVHSLKDLPTTMPAGLRLVAVLPRADTSDVLIFKDEGRRQKEEGRSSAGDAAPGAPPSAFCLLPSAFSSLLPGSVIATSSLRRQWQLLHHRPDLRMSEVRGNVGTRLGKLRARTDWAGLVLARAGLERLGFEAGLRTGVLETEHGSFAVEILGPEVMLPAVGQGAIGLQCRADDERALAALAAVNHAPTWAAVSAERALLELLGGGCQLPLGVATGIVEGEMRLRAIYFDAPNTPPRLAEVRGRVDEPRALATAAARQLGAS